MEWVNPPLPPPPPVTGGVVVGADVVAVDATGVIERVSVGRKPSFVACIVSVVVAVGTKIAVPLASVVSCGSSPRMVLLAAGAHFALKLESKANCETVIVVVAPTSGVVVDTEIFIGFRAMVTKRCSPAVRTCWFIAVMPYVRSANHPQ